MSDNLRKCVMCGSSPAKDALITLHRFPKPGRTNSLRCEVWAKYCFPHESWSSLEFQQKLFSQHKMLCNKHFAATCFVENKLFKTAVPGVGCGEPELSDGRRDNYIDDHNYHSKKDPPPPQSKDDHNYWKKLPVLRPKPQPPRTGETQIYLPTENKATNTPNRGPDYGHSSGSTTECESIYSRPIKAIDEAKDETENAAIRELNEQDFAEDPMLSDSEDQDEPLFSWQASTQITLEDDELAEEKTREGLDPTKNAFEDVVLLEEEYAPKVAKEKVEYKSEKHTGYSCDHCLKDIIGFRYRCVQCDNFDLCHACECKLVHPHHYVLRIPRPTPFTEVDRILEAIKDKIKLLSEEMQSISDSMNLDDIKQEAPFEEVLVDPFKEVDGIEVVQETQSGVSEAEVPEAEVDRPQDMNMTHRILEEWVEESENRETRKRKRSYSEESLREDNQKSFKLENNDRQTLNFEEVRDKYLNEMWLNENDPKNCPDDEVRIRENHEVEWLDESILENEENICTMAPKTSVKEIDDTLDGPTKFKLSESCLSFSRKRSDQRKQQNISPLLRPKPKRINILPRSSKFNKPSS